MVDGQSSIYQRREQAINEDATSLTCCPSFSRIPACNRDEFFSSFIFLCPTENTAVTECLSLPTSYILPGFQMRFLPTGFDASGTSYVAPPSKGNSFRWVPAVGEKRVSGVGVDGILRVACVERAIGTHGALFKRFRSTSMPAMTSSSRRLNETKRNTVSSVTVAVLSACLLCCPRYFFVCAFPRCATSTTAARLARPAAAVAVTGDVAGAEAGGRRRAGAGQGPGRGKNPGPRRGAVMATLPAEVAQAAGASGAAVEAPAFSSPTCRGRLKIQTSVPASRYFLSTSLWRGGSCVPCCGRFLLWMTPFVFFLTALSA